MHLPHLLNGSSWGGMRVGLFGGSFNPPHEGHRHIALAALKRLDLHVIWWILTPQNPLKDSPPVPLAVRMALCNEVIAGHPRMMATDLEISTRTTHTYETVRALQKRFVSTHFVWISGMDNALTFHHWQNWRALLECVCTFYFARPPAESLIRRCPLRAYAPQRHIVLDDGGLSPPLTPRTTYWILESRMVDSSSTTLRGLPCSSF